MFELVFWRKFEAGHRLIEEENKNTVCVQPHGHTWQVKVYISALQKKTLDHKKNTIILFSKIKTQWHKWIDDYIDHSFIFNQRDPLLDFIRSDIPNGRHVVVPGDPTTEMIAVVLKAKLETFLKNKPFKCSRIELNETQTNGIIFYGNPLIHLPSSKKQPWWLKADFSTNDF